MKTKLTLTIDEDVIPDAKRYAKEQGVSLSQLVETSLRELAQKQKGSFSSRWRGRLRPSEGPDDARRRKLTQRFL